MPDHTLSSSISSTKIFPEFLLPIEEFTLHQRKKLEGALQLHFTHWDHAEGVCLLQGSEVFFSFPYCIPNHSLEGKTNTPWHFYSWAFCKAIPQMLLHSLKCGSCWTRWDRKDFSKDATPSNVRCENYHKKSRIENRSEGRLLCSRTFFISS